MQQWTTDWGGEKNQNDPQGALQSVQHMTLSVFI